VSEPLYEQPITAAEREAGLAELEPSQREALETLLWSREVDARPIGAAFGKCVDDRFAAASAEQASAIIDACFPIIERLVRGRAMEITALATSPSGAEMNGWADSQAEKQKVEWKALLVKRFETRASTPDR
jgi:hypothetical protein